MTREWPSFVTRDLGDSEEDDAEAMRRWEAYDRGMKALVGRRRRAPRRGRMVGRGRDGRIDRPRSGTGAAAPRRRAGRDAAAGRGAGSGEEVKGKILMPLYRENVNCAINSFNS